MEIEDCSPLAVAKRIATITGQGATPTADVTLYERLIYVQRSFDGYNFRFKVLIKGLAVNDEDLRKGSLALIETLHDLSNVSKSVSASYLGNTYLTRGSDKQRRRRRH